MDLDNAHDNLEKFKKEFPNLDIIAISAYSLDGIEQLVIKLADKLENIQEEVVTSSEEVVYKFEEKKPFTIEKSKDGWVLKGDAITRLFKMTRFDEDESVMRFAKKLKNMGIEDELENLGAKKGDDVVICDYVFQFKD